LREIAMEPSFIAAVVAGMIAYGLPAQTAAKNVGLSADSRGVQCRDRLRAGGRGNRTCGPTFKTTADPNSPFGFRAGSPAARVVISEADDFGLPVTRGNIVLGATCVLLIDAATLPVCGADTAKKALDPSLSANALIHRAALMLRRAGEP
jgi:hypothetical protein